MSLPGALAFFAVMLVLAAMPSASVALVVTRSATHGVRSGLAAAGGVVLGDLLFVSLVLLGMGMLANTLSALFALLKIAGGAYLIWLGLSLLRSWHRGDHRSLVGGGSAMTSSAAAGLLLTLGDVKAVLFYASLFPQLFDLAALTAEEVLLIVATTVVTVGAVKSAYAVGATHIARRLSGTRTARRGQLLAGSALVGTGAYLLAKG